jgi:DNA-binding SARP family transcriptional activator
MTVFHLLGPLEVRDCSGAQVPLTRRKSRTLLALLLLRAGTNVEVDEMVDALWDSRPPASARANLYSYISHLRHVLHRAVPEAGARPCSTLSGYRLDLLPGECDAQLFEHLAGTGRRALAGGHHALAAEYLARALGLWRGAALLGVDGEWVVPTVARLNHARLRAFEDHVDSRLLLGQHVEVAIELTATVHRHPLRERLWGQLMIALHGAGRRIESVQAYDRLCTLLDVELGIGPSAPLRALHRAVRCEDRMLEAGPAEALRSLRQVNAREAGVPVAS